MNNSDIINGVVDYIGAVKKERNITDNALARMCEDKGQEKPPKASTIRNMFNRPSSLTMSTLLKVCDGLDLNLRAIFHAIELALTADGDKEQRLIYDINNNGYGGYLGEYHVFFLPTHPNKTTSPDYEDEEVLLGTSRDAILAAEQEDEEFRLARTRRLPVHGRLLFSDKYGTGECTASLTIDTGDFDDKAGMPIKKQFEGALVYSTNGLMFGKLVSSRYGDTWSLVLRHVSLNNKPLQCSMGCASTSSSGTSRVPTIHNFCIVNAQMYREVDEEKRMAIKGLLRVHGRHILISKDEAEAFLQMDGLDDNFKRNLSRELTDPLVYYRIPKEHLREGVDPIVFAKALAEMCNHSALSRAYHTTENDDNDLVNLMKARSTKSKEPESDDKKDAV